MLDKITPLVVRAPEQIKKLRQVALNNGLPETIYEDFAVYANYMVPKIKVGKTYHDWSWFHWYICKNYNEAVFGDGTLLTIEIGPQVGKSILTALFITFVFGVSPDTSIIYASYNEKIAINFSKRYVTKFMTNAKYKKIFPHISLKYELDKKDSSNEGAAQRKSSTMKDDEFTLSNALTKENYNGGYRCYGIDQGIHGVPADIFIIDDYISKGDKVRSENFRNKLREWFYNDMPSRLQDNSSILIALCTRWFKDDIIGMLHQSYYEDVVPALNEAGIAAPRLNKIRIRAEYRVNDDNPPEDPRTRDGQVLWPVHILKYSFAKKGQHYQAMYNCDTSEGDDMRNVRESDFGGYMPEQVPRTASLYVVVDGASTTGSRSDHTAIGVFAKAGKKNYIIKLWYVKLETPALIRLVEKILTVEFPNYFQCLVEFANSGIAISQHLTEKKLRHVPLNFSGRPLNSSAYSKKVKTDVNSKATSKMDRFLKGLPEIVNPEQNFLLPIVRDKEEEQLFRTFLFQVCNFTGERNRGDDMVDILSYYIIYTMMTVVYSYNSNNASKKNVDKSSNMRYNLPNANYFARVNR